MIEFIANGIFWTLAIYGLIEIIKTIFNSFTYTNFKDNGVYIVIAVKNQEDKIEGVIRSILFRILYGKEENINDLIIVDLDSTDRTHDILSRLQSDYKEIKVTNWRTCKELIDGINKN